MKGDEGTVRIESMREKQNAIAIGVLLVATIVALAGLFGLMATDKPQQEDAAITISGTITCLPHKGDGPHTLECAVGLQGDDNRYYLLKDLPPQYSETFAPVRISGVLSAPASDTTYDIAGTITVSSVERK